MSKTVPDWLDKDFFTKVIRNYTNDEEAILVSFSIRSGSNAGENFASDLFRVTLNYSKTPRTSTAGGQSLISRNIETISVIVKSLPVNEDVDIDNHRMFLNEMRMYGESLVDIDRIVRMAYGELKLFPSLIYQTTEPTAVIVLEDLSSYGFATVCAPDENLETTKMIFYRLAIFHAASFYLADNGADYTSFNYSVYHMPESIQESFFKHNLRIFKNLMLNNAWPEMNESKYVKRVDEMIEKCTERGKRVFSISTSGFNCLNHGDFFMRNMLFRRAAVDGRICDVQFLDFQLSVYASPAVDIFMALYGSMTLENRLLYRNEMILFYYETFVDSLKRFGYVKEPPTLLDLHVELTRCGALGAQLCLCYLPYLLSEFDKVNSDVMYVVNDDTESSKRNLYLNENYAKVIKEEFKEFFYNGFI